MPITQLKPTPAHRRLRLFSAIAAVIALLTVVGAVAYIVTRSDTILHIHSGLGMLYAVAALLAVVPATVWGQETKSPGVSRHAMVMVIAGIAQVGLGMVGSGPSQPSFVILAHIGLGLLVLFGAAALWDTARRMPIIVTGTDHPSA